MRTTATEQSKPITVVIPLVQAHDHYIPGLLASLTGESDHIHEVILARSSLERQRSPDYSKWALSLGETYGLKVVAVTTHKRATAGANRNRGWALATTTYVAFLDADDIYENDRLQQMLSVAEKFNANLVLHAFWSIGSEWKTPTCEPWQFEDVVHTREIFSATFPNGRYRKGEGRIPGDTNVIIPDLDGKPRSVAHGHMLVRTSIQEHVRFGRRYPGEDGQFCRDVLWNLGGVSYIPARLSVYRASLTAEASSQLLDKIMRRVRSLRELGWAALYR